MKNETIRDLFKICICVLFLCLYLAVSLLLHRDLAYACQVPDARRSQISDFCTVANVYNPVTSICCFQSWLEYNYNAGIGGCSSAVSQLSTAPSGCQSYKPWANFGPLAHAPLISVVGLDKCPGIYNASSMMEYVPTHFGNVLNCDAFGKVCSLFESRLCTGTSKVLTCGVLSTLNSTKFFDIPIVDGIYPTQINEEQAANLYVGNSVFGLLLDNSKVSCRSQYSPPTYGGLNYTRMDPYAPEVVNLNSSALPWWVKIAISIGVSILQLIVGFFNSEDEDTIIEDDRLLSYTNNMHLNQNDEKERFWKFHVPGKYNTLIEGFNIIMFLFSCYTASVNTKSYGFWAFVLCFMDIPVNRYFGYLNPFNVINLLITVAFCWIYIWILIPIGLLLYLGSKFKIDVIEMYGSIALFSEFMVISMVNYCSSYSSDSAIDSYGRTIAYDSSFSPYMDALVATINTRSISVYWNNIKQGS